MAEGAQGMGSSLHRIPPTALPSSASCNSVCEFKASFEVGVSSWRFRFPGRGRSYQIATRERAETEGEERISLKNLSG